MPLVASQHVLGLLSLGDTHAQAFTQEHLRLAKSLAIPAAVAIQNARLYEQAEIFDRWLGDARAGPQLAYKNSPHVRVRNHITRFRRSSGEPVETIYSAESVELEGRECLLAVSEDAPNQANLQTPLVHKSVLAH